MVSSKDSDDDVATNEDTTVPSAEVHVGTRLFCWGVFLGGLIVGAGFAVISLGGVSTIAGQSICAHCNICC
jgi:hypothetical protein